MTMVKGSIYAMLLSIALAGGISTRVQAQDEVVHVFECPVPLRIWLYFEHKISSDPSFSREGHGQQVSVGLVDRGRDGQTQTVYCSYRLTIDGVGSNVRYRYTVKRKILSCENVGMYRFTCRLKP
jgi:hypothetical protein